MSQLHIIEALLHNWSMRFQDPTIKKTEGRNAQWYIRPVVPIVGVDGVEHRQQRIYLGRVKDTPKTKAQQEKQRVMAEINGGRAVLQAQITLGDLVGRFREARLPLLASTTRGKYEAHLKNHVGELANLKLFEIKPDMVQAWLIGKPLASATKTDVKNLLSAIFEQARKWGLWDQPNPIQMVELPRHQPVREKRIPTADEVRRLREALDCCGSVTRGITGPMVRLMLDVVICTGWRISEVLALRADAIGDDVLEVRRAWRRGDLSEAPKTEAGRRRNLAGGLTEELLAAIRPGSEFVFQAIDGQPPDDRDIMQHILRPCAQAVGCYWQGFGFHTFRRMNLTWRSHLGATPFEVSLAAGHSKVDTSLIYQVADRGREREVVEGIKRRVQ